MNTTNTIYSFCSNDPFLFYHHSLSPKCDKPLTYENETHPGYEILYLSRGSVNYYIEGVEYVVGEGDVIILKSNEVHKLVVDLSIDYDRQVIQFSNELFPSNANLNRSIVMGVIENVDNLIRIIPSETVKKLGIDKIFSSFDEYASNIDAFTLARYSTAVINLFIAFNMAFNKRDSLAPVKTHNALIKEISDYIALNLQNKISLKDIAKHVNFSESRLCHIFSKTMGISLHKYVTLKRIQHAQNLIKHGKSLTEASLLSGFQYYSTFYNNYKALIGEPPSTENIRKW